MKEDITEIIMMVLLYNITISIYGLIIRIFSVFNSKAELFIKGRRNWKENLMSKIDKNAPYIWIHCASLGEFEQGRPVIEEIKSKFPAYKILLTFFSSSGYEIRKNYQSADIVSYLPLDTPKNAGNFLDITKPVKAFFVKYEFWYNYLNNLQKQNIPTYVFSANFRKKQHFFRAYPWSKWFRKMLSVFEMIFVQSSESCDILKSFGFKNVSISGDTRFDRVAKIAESSKDIPIVNKFKGNNFLIIAGSTWKPDEELIIRFINQNDNIKFIIAPHEVSGPNINRIIQLLKKQAVRFSEINESNAQTADVIVIDSVGFLSSLYKYGEIAYIGGGFGVGIHNILEAATFGLPVVFGPNHEKFREARNLKSLNGAFSIRNFDELDTIFRTLIGDQAILKKTSLVVRNYVADNIGATQVIIETAFCKKS